MIKHALFVRLEAKPGKEKELAQFLQTGLGMAQQETTTPVWFALQLGASTFGIFDAFLDEARAPGSPRWADRAGTRRERAQAAGQGSVDRAHRGAGGQAAWLKCAKCFGQRLIHGSNRYQYERTAVRR
jgi:hypothetical protein